MPKQLLVLHWPDFSARFLEGRHVSPGLVAHALQRQLRIRFGACPAWVWAPAAAGTGAQADFRRHGLSLLDGEPDAESVAGLTEHYPDAACVVLAMAPQRASPIRARLHQAGCQAEVWAPDDATGPADETLSRLLHLETAHPVGLLVEWPGILRLSQRASGRPEPAVLLEALLQGASLVGSVVTARLFGREPEGRVLELAGTEPAPRATTGEHLEQPAADLLMGFHGLLREPTIPQTIIVCSEDPRLIGGIRHAHERGARVLVWPDREERLPSMVAAEADGVASLASVLGTELAALPRRRAEARAGAAAGGRREGRLPETGAEGASSAGNGPGDPVLPDPVSVGARQGSWTRLIYHVECVQRRSGGRVPFRRLAVALAEVEEFGPTPANALMWLNRARTEGMVRIEPGLHAQEPAVGADVCRPNLEHPLARAAVDVPDRCLRLLHQMLQKMPWVSFKLLRNVLLREQWLGGSSYRLDESGVDEWLNFLIHDGALLMTKEPNLVNPDYPVTALRLNPDHPIASIVTTETLHGSRLAAERAILAVDHFLTRNRKPWMSISALRRALDTMSREELQEVLQGLQSLGALVTESYPNPQKEHPTTGCRLKPDQPIVVKVLGMRDAIIRVTQHHQRFPGWVPLARLDETLSTELGTEGAANRQAWFRLLRDEGILELDHDDPIPDTVWSAVHCRLNVSDSVVRSVVAQFSGGAAPGPPPEARPREEPDRESAIGNC